MPSDFTHVSSAHRTVLAKPAVDLLFTTPDGVYADGTYGRGGHSRLLLARLSPRGRLFAFDRDPEAVAAARAVADSRFECIHAPFSRMQAELATRGVTRLAGVLLDLGVSSPQIDDPRRGFSFRGEGPLDMRMDTTRGETAAQWLARATVDELTRVIRDYGEERFAASIAKAIVARRTPGSARGGPLVTTADLARVVEDAVPRAGRKSQRGGSQHPATRTFQAVRIHVNQELEELALALDQMLQLLDVGGRMAVVSFHSLEDRMVKRFIDAHARPARALARLPLREDQMPAPTLHAIAKVLPDAAEVEANPRARSAVLRVAERTAAALPEPRP
jgi:16S rRNA (cytosine1402-N4)-methyltransferase